MRKGRDYIGVAVGAIIFNDKGAVFLSKRSKNTKNERGCWEFPGGSIEFGELMVEAVKREIREEYGIDIDILQQLPAHDHIIPADKQHWVATTFRAKVKDDQEPRILEPDKCDEIGWFSFDNLPEPLSLITKMDIETYKKVS